ncbi:N-acetyltransferase [Larkinella bovis]|uniref:N-acetyltransferase n=1 Tax=Larkinella bovis TaxID=683041 RepID=A0ABW0I7J2_9BACT
MILQEMAVSINRAENRFELEMEGKLSFITYFPKDDQTLVLTRTKLHPNLVHNGVDSLLFSGMLEYIEKHRLTIIPLCTLLAAYLKQHTEYLHLLNPEYRIKMK